MIIHWHNIIALAFAILAGVLFVKHREALSVALASVQHIGPGSGAEEKTLGLIILGILCVLVVALVRILVGGTRK